MAPPRKSAPRKPRSKQTAPKDAAASAEKSAKVADGDTKALDEVGLYEKVDLAAPESPVLPKTNVVNASPREPKPVKLEAGDTAAAHEAHRLNSSRERISERIEAEKGPDGLAADVVARRQFEEGRKVEEGRVTSKGERTTAIARSLGTRDSERPKRGGDAA